MACLPDLFRYYFYGGYSVAGLTRQIVALKTESSNLSTHPFSKIACLRYITQIGDFLYLCYVYYFSAGDSI